METETATITVLDASRARRMPTGHVTVTCPSGATDRQLADAAGFGGRHFGFSVSRHDDGTASVALFND
ncbi:hypothetical protein ACJ5H2_13365 [Nocardioides sp. R1-1]|uniref:hypothetical protein n=1 Tax=Nocardioides sp. R1-1 TaxID=3383502 RepID=UPI0038D0EC90